MKTSHFTGNFILIRKLSLLDGFNHRNNGSKWLSKGPKAEVIKLLSEIEPGKLTAFVG